nr:hypothetical protein [Streptomyces antimycoticus]
MPRPVPRTDVLLNLFGAPHQSDLVTSALRLASALLARGPGCRSGPAATPPG